MPIATPEVYAEMLDRAKAGAFAYPAINVHVLADAERRAARLRRGRQRRHHPGLHRRRRVPLRPDASRTWSTGAVALAEFAHEVAKKYPVNIALHTDHCPKDKLDGFVRPLLAASQRARRAPAARRCSSRTCGTARRCRSTENLADRPGAARPVPRRPTSSSRSRSASSAARRTASPTRSTRSSTPTPEDAIATRRGARPRRERPLPARR